MKFHVYTYVAGELARQINLETYEVPVLIMHGPRNDFYDTNAKLP